MGKVVLEKAALVRASIAVAALLFILPTLPAQPKPARSWAAFGGSVENIHYSQLNQINPANVAKLRVAWTYETGDAFKGSEMQCNPIVSGGLLYATTPKLRVIALDPATGREQWSFDPLAGQEIRGGLRNRGVNYWARGERARVLVAARNYLYSLDARTGKPGPGFGQSGRIDLREGFERPVGGLSMSLSTPGVVFGDLLIIGSIVSEDLPAAPGDIRAFDIPTGKLKWSFHTIPHPGEPGYETWPKDAWQRSGGANNWAGMALDPVRGIVYVPTGSAAFDFYGADRHGDNLYANTLLALDARTGKKLWHFQAVKHDVWDRDFPSAPALVTVRRGGKPVDAVAQITKSGHVFVLDRVTGKSLFPLVESRVPASTVAGEQLAETQVLPSLPEPFARQQVTEDLLTDRTPEAQQWARARFQQVSSRGAWDPPSERGTIVFPGYDGGGEWGGAAFDPESRWLYVNSNEMAWVLRLVRRSQASGGGRAAYLRNCSGCHREDLSGSPPQFPALKNLSASWTEEKLVRVMRSGVGRMPAFGGLPEPTLRAIARYLGTGEDVALDHRASSESPQLAYQTDGYNKFVDPDGYPAIKPPWGTLNAINLDTGKIEWKIPFGEIPALAQTAYRNSGSENYGGGIVTQNGLFFIAATNYDRKIRAFDKRTGKLLWEHELPFSGNATPAMYEVAGKQYLVIGAGGGKSGNPSGGVYVAFALPD